MKQTFTRLAHQPPLLLFDGVEENILVAAACRQPAVKRRAMFVTAAEHFCGQRLMPQEQGPQFTPPAQGFRVSRVSAAPSANGKDIPKTVQFTVFSQQVFAAEMLWMDVPDAHNLAGRPRSRRSGADSTHGTGILAHDRVQRAPGKYRFEEHEAREKLQHRAPQEETGCQQAAGETKSGQPVRQPDVAA